MPAPILAGLGRSVAAAAQAAARVATAVGQGMGRAASAAVRGGAEAGGTAGRAVTTAARAGAGAAGAATASPSAAAYAANSGRMSMAAARAQESGKMMSRWPNPRMAEHPVPSPAARGGPQSPGQFLKNLFRDWSQEVFGAAGGGRRGGDSGRDGGGSGGRGGGGRGGRSGGGSGGAGSGGREGSGRGGSSGSLDMLREGMSRWDRIQRGLATIADVAITAQSAGNFTGGKSMGGILARQVGSGINSATHPLGVAGMGQVGSITSGANQLGIPTSPTKVIVDFGIKLSESVKRLDEFGRGLVEARRPLALYEGRMAASVAQLDVDRVRRDIRRARGTGGSSADQTRAQSRLEEALLPSQMAMQNAINRIVSAIENGAAFVIEKINKHPIVGPLLNFLGAEVDKENEKDNAVLIDFAQRLSKGEFDERRFKPLPRDWLPPRGGK